jgi:hypothetical protein
MGLRVIERSLDRNITDKVDENFLQRKFDLSRDQRSGACNHDGTIRVPGDEISLDVSTEKSIDMVPALKQGAINVQRFKNDILSLAKEYTVEVDSQLRWLMVSDFRPPKNYSPSSIGVLMLIPPDYPQTPPGLGHHNIYVRKNLRRKDGKRIKHFFAKVNHCNRGCCDLSHHSWFWWCLAGINWDPRFNDFLTIMNMLHVCMTEAAR